jgi:RNA polymerase sigma-70 factor (ECF subfamily)
MAGLKPDEFFGGTRSNRAGTTLQPTQAGGIAPSEFFAGTAAPVANQTPKRESRWGVSAFAQGVKDVVTNELEGRNKPFYAVMSALGQIAPDDPNFTPMPGQDDPFAETRALRRRVRGDEVDAQQQGREGFLDSLRNPYDAFANTGMTSALIREGGVMAPVTGAARINEARAIGELEERKRAARQRILASPEEYPEVTVQAARDAEIAYQASQGKSVVEKGGEILNRMGESISEDPGKFVAEIANSVMADPAMLAAPAGSGLKPIQGASRVLRRPPPVPNSAVARIDNIADAALTGAAVNVGIDSGLAADRLAEYTPEQVAVSATLGGILSGGTNALFSGRGSALDRVKGGRLGADDLKAALDEQEVIEQTLANPDVVPVDVRTRIEESLGIKNLSQADRKKYLDQRRRELVNTFKENSLEADYFEYQARLADDRRVELAAERQRRSEAEALELARQQQVAREMSEDRTARAARFNEDYERALAQRDAQELAGQQVDAELEDSLRTAQARAAEEELIEAAVNGGLPQVQRAIERARARDSRTNWKNRRNRGEIDPVLLTRLGLGATFGLGAYTLADADQKLGAAFAAGLAGLLIPGGGSVRNIMRQSGVVDLGGNFTSMQRLVKEGKLKPDRDAARQMDLDNDAIARARQGDQTGFKHLYDEYFSKMERYIKKQLSTGVAARTGIEPTDIAQEVFIDAFNQLDQYTGNVPFSAYLSRIASNKVVDAQRAAQTLKGGKDKQIGTMYRVMDEDGDMTGDGMGLDPEVEMAASTLDSPENNLIRQQSEQIILNTIKKFNDRQRESFILNRVEGYTAEEIASMTDQPLSTVLMQIKRAGDAVTEALAKGLNAVDRTKVATVVDETPKRGRGRPRKQAGEIDPRLLQLGGVAALGAGAGAYLNEQNKLLGAGIGALLAVGLRSKLNPEKSVGRAIVEGLDATLGATSTRIKNIAPPLWRRAIELERVVLRDTHKHMANVDPFLVGLNKLDPETQGILSRAILTGKPGVTDKLLNQLGDRDLIAGWKQVRSTLDSLRDQLVALKRFAPSDIEYFPRIVTDVPGLLKALGREKSSGLAKVLADAENKSMKTTGTALSDIEKSLIISKYLATESKASQQPGFAKDRVIEEITPELQKFYASPTESLHSYIRNAVQDIERAKFFGRDIDVIVKDGKQFTNVDGSVGNVVNRMLDDGTITTEQAEEVAQMLRARFMNGERAPAALVQGARNLSYAGLLGNFASASVQLGDIALQAYAQGLRPTLSGLVKSITGKKLVDMKDFGLVDHISQEFVGTGWTTKALNKVFKATLFSWADELGKNTALNAAVIRFGKLAKTEKGVQEINAKYGDSLQPGEIRQLVKDLQNGEVTDLVRSIAFAELSRTQPITRLEMPQAYLNNPNGRVLYMLKSFTLKQIDLVRRDAYNEIKKGDTQGIKSGVKNLANLAIMMSVAGVGTDLIRDVITGRDVQLDDNVAFSLLKTYGLSKYFIDQAFGVSKEEAQARRDGGDPMARSQKAEPVTATANLMLPPLRMWDQILRGDPNAIRYIPGVGPILLEQYKQERAE